MAQSILGLGLWATSNGGAFESRWPSEVRSITAYEGRIRWRNMAKGMAEHPQMPPKVRNLSLACCADDVRR